MLLEIAYRLPGSEAELARIEGLPSKLLNRTGKDLLQAVAAASADEHDYRPPRPPDERQKALLKDMQARVQKRADELDIAAETLASKRELVAAIVSDNRDSRVFSGWRRDLIGNDLLALL